MSVPRNRRGALRVLLATAFTAVTAPVVAAAASRSRPLPATDAQDPRAPRRPHRHETHAAHEAHGAPRAQGSRVAEALFDEVYRGRRIRGFRSHARSALAEGALEWHVTVDDQPLHLMRRADGSYLSMIDHYGSYPTPRAAARAAVDQLLPGERLTGLSHGAPAAGAPGAGAGGAGAPGGGAPGTGRGASHGVHP
ncbi:tyrosinase family oxidase copper chaperone [Streptomyces sp. NPDC047130]|uniref:tyrosinase family oxidase copper chaperone n=1 Tax=Streptomyces sp. NPDC047130 TaxID=3155261 RepID=UPI0033C3ACF0